MLTGNHTLMQQQMQQQQQQRQQGGTPGVLTGNRQQQAMPGMQPNAQQGQAQQANPLLQMVQFAQRWSGSTNGSQNGSSNLYNFGNTNTNVAALLGMDEGIAEEQMKAQALQQGSQYGQIAINICMRRQANNPIYKAFLGAMERFKIPRKNLPQEQILVDFVNEINANTMLFNYIVCNAGIQLTSEIAWRIMQGDQAVTQNREVINVISEAMFRASVDSINLQFIDYLVSHPEGASIYYRASPILKETLGMIEKASYEVALTRFNWIGQQTPWKNGRLAELQSRSSTESPMAAFQNFAEVADFGFGGGYINPNAIIQNNSTSGDQIEMQKTMEYINRTAAAYRSGESVYAQPVRDEEFFNPAQYDQHDVVQRMIEDITVENRLKYRLEDYATQIPGTDYWVMPTETMLHVVTALRDINGSKIERRPLRNPFVIPIFEINWREGTCSYKQVAHNFTDADYMARVISNPSILLPLMYDQDGLQKTTFDPTVLETAELVVNGAIIPIEEAKVLDKQPDLIIGSNVMKADMTNEDILRKVDVVTNHFDPKGKMDAFIIPMSNMRQWHVEAGLNMDKLYSDFAVMTKGYNDNAGVTDTARVIRTIRSAAAHSESAEFVSFLDPYLTSLINRYLVECRGYAETPEEAKRDSLKGLTIDSAFGDLDDLLEWFKDNDQQTLTAFLDYKSNEFMRNGIEILMTQEKAEAYHQEAVANEEDEIIKAATLADRKKSLMMQRDTMFVNIQEQGPTGTDAIVIKESINPKLFAILRKVMVAAEKRFDTVPQLLIKFAKDSTHKVWAATYSEIDSEHVLVIRLVSSEESYTHPWMVHG